MSTASDAFRREANELLREALDVPEADRSRFLDERCAEQPELRQEVRVLLDSLERAGQFLETPALPRTSELLDAATRDAVKDRRIGPFLVKGVIASGGMGTVYEAEQSQPKRTVALKIINAGIASTSGQRRFEYESQYLARLQHPNVAQVYDAGLHEEETTLGHRSLPYFAMELIAGGKPITDASQIGGLSLQRRLEMFLKVADAVHHGHQKGIVHRDLKPSNILVDQHGEPKIIDYGVARLVGEERADAVTQTLTGQLVGTLQYMSPEQCSRDPSDIDIRSDVYALGLVLFEMITGQRPYDVQNVQVEEATRIIREQPPASMSSLGCRVPRDLETIVRKALEKDRDRRYQSAAQMHRDVQRYLSNEPIEARPPSMFYQLRMFARRNRTTVIAASAIVLTLVLAALVSTVFAFRASRQRDVAVWNSYIGNAAAAEAAYRASEFRRMRNHLANAPEHLRGWEWYYLNRLAEPSLAVLTDHEHMLADVAFSPDGTLLASSSRDHTVLVRDADSFGVIHTLVHPDQALGPAFSPDGLHIATGCRDGIVRIWSARTGELISEMPGHSEQVLKLEFSHDGRFLATASFDGNARIWRTADYSPLHELKSHTDRVRTVRFDSTSQRVYSAADDGKLIMWNVTTGALLEEVQVNTPGLRDLVLSADGTIIYCAGVDGSITTWEASSLRPMERIHVNGDAVWTLSISPDGTLLAAGHADHSITLIDLTGANSPRSLRGHGELIHGLAFHPDGTRLASASWDRTLRIWDAGPVDRFEVLRTGDEQLLDVATSPLGDRAATVGRDGVLRIWMLETGSILASIAEPEIDFYSVDFSSDGQRIAVGGTDGLIRVFDTATGANLAQLRGHSDVAYSVAFLPGRGGDFLVSASDDGTARIWEIFSGRTLHLLDRHEDGVWSVAASPDGQTIATTSRDATVMLWSAETGELLHTLRGHKQDVYAACFSPDGNILATGSRDQSIRIWNVRTGAAITELTGHGQFVTDLRFLPDGSRLVSVSWFQTIKFWDVETWQEVVSLLAHEQAIRSVAITPDGTRVLTASHDGTARIWDVMTTQQRREQEAEAIRRHDAAQRDVEKLLAEWEGDPQQVARLLRQNQSLDDHARQDALNALLHLVIGNGRSVVAPMERTQPMREESTDDDQSLD